MVGYRRAPWTIFGAVKEIQGCDRREFVTLVGHLVGAGVLMSSAACLGCAMASSTHPMSALKVAKVDVSDLTKDGKALFTPYVGPDGDQIMIVREPGGSLVALSTQCTHAGCKVNAPSGGIITCPCHGSQYDLTGNVVRGPAPRALKQYQILSYGNQRKTLMIQLR
jgi:Rieske Fe-S protein